MSDAYTEEEISVAKPVLLLVGVPVFIGGLVASTVLWDKHSPMVGWAAMASFFLCLIAGGIAMFNMTPLHSQQYANKAFLIGFVSVPIGVFVGGMTVALEGNIVKGAILGLIVATVYSFGSVTGELSAGK